MPTSRVDFIFMLTRNDRTVDDAESIVDAVCDLGVGHIGFKDVGIAFPAMQRLVERIRRRGRTVYLEVVSTTQQAARASLAVGRALDVDCILGGTDLAAARDEIGELARYYPFPGRPVGHPTRLAGTPAEIAADCVAARDAGCAGVDLLAYRAMQAEPLELLRAARAAWPSARLIVAGSVTTRAQIDAIARAGANAFTIGSAAFEGGFSPSKGSLQSQIVDILDACDHASQLA
jgi:DNA-binding NarL/FixJ family response regulator